MPATYAHYKFGKKVYRALPGELRETFDLRAAYPDATLAELVMLHSGRISRSGVCHRLKKIIAFAEQCVHADAGFSGDVPGNGPE